MHHHLHTSCSHPCVLHARMAYLNYSRLIMMATLPHGLNCGRALRSSCMLLCLAVCVCAAAPRTCAPVAARADPTAAAPSAGHGHLYSSAARFAALPGPTQALVSDVVSMLHGGMPANSVKVLLQLADFLAAHHHQLQLDPESYSFAAAMVVGGLHNALHHDDPSMQWPFQQYSGSIHWLRRLEAGTATAADEALLKSSNYSRRYPSGLVSSWEQVRDPPPHMAWTSPVPLYHTPANIFDILQSLPLPNLDTQMVTSWGYGVAYAADGQLVWKKPQVHVVDIDNPDGPACEGCQPYVLTSTSLGGQSCQCAGAQSGQQQGKEIHQGGAGSNPGQEEDTPAQPFVRLAYDSPAHPAPAAADSAPWHVHDMHVLLHVLLWGALGVACAWLAWWLWSMQAPVVTTAPDRALRAPQRRQQQRQQPNQQHKHRQHQGPVHGWLGVPCLVLCWFHNLPWGRVLLVLVLKDVTKRVEEHWPVQTAAVAQGWAQVQQASNPFVADCLAYAVFTLVFWRCLHKRRPVASLLPVLLGTALVQVVTSWERYVVLQGSPNWFTSSKYFVSLHIARWSWMSAAVYLVVCSLQGIAKAVGSVVVPVARPLWVWVGRLWQRMQPVHTTPGASNTQQRQQQHGSGSSWMQLPKPIASMLSMVSMLPGGPATLLVVVMVYGVSPLERCWPVQAVAAVRWWARVQQTLHPLVADCLGHVLFSCVYWVCRATQTSPPVSLLGPLLVGTVLSQIGWHLCISIGICRPSVLLSGYLRHWALKTMFVYWSVKPVGTLAGDNSSAAQHAMGHQEASTTPPGRQPQRQGSSKSCDNNSSAARQRRAEGPRRSASTAAAASQQAADVVRGAAGAGGWAGLVTWAAQLGGVVSHGRKEAGTSEAVSPPQPAPATPAAGVTVASSAPSSSSTSRAADPTPIPATATATATATAATEGEGVSGSSNSSTGSKPPRDQHHNNQQQQQQSAPPAAEPPSTPTNHNTSSPSISSTSATTAGCCRVCGLARGPGVKLFKCSKCGGAADRYCSGTCFKVDWPRHKVSCKAGV